MTRMTRMTRGASPGSPGPTAGEGEWLRLPARIIHGLYGRQAALSRATVRIVAVPAGAGRRKLHTRESLGIDWEKIKMVLISVEIARQTSCLPPAGIGR